MLVTSTLDLDCRDLESKPLGRCARVPTAPRVSVHTPEQAALAHRKEAYIFGIRNFILHESRHFCVWDKGSSSMDAAVAATEQSSCAQCTVKPKKPKHRSLELREVYCRAEQGERVFVLKNPELLDGLEGEVFIGEIWGEGCRIHDYLLIGWR